MAAPSGSLAVIKLFHLGLVWMALAAPSLLVHVAQAKTVRCQQAVSNLTPCFDYLINGGVLASTSSCCNGLKTTYARATTATNRKAFCTCLKSVFHSISFNANQLRNAQQLPGKCGVRLAFKVDPNVDCNKVR